VLREVRCGNSGAPQALPFIFLTGVTESEVVRVALELDANGFMPKPFKPADLDMRLHRVLSNPHPVKSPATYARVIPPRVRQPGGPEEPEPKRAYQPQRGIEKAVKELAEGAVLAVDVQSTLGSVLVSAGITVNGSLRDKLNDLVDVGVIPPLTRIEG
jgi:two-component system OmpR family response regulator